MHELDEQILAFRGLSDEPSDDGDGDDGIIEDDDTEDLDELGFGTEEDSGVME